ncbi:MAG: hypothetical protein DRP67_00130 [Candidatus Omnitrophota bacterium]|nr:MAG: hypothetical protein DRP67_00130 [Candidatus Omnitrophota bacterium]HDN98155.1 hypothetical protein [bacterium]
MNRKFFENINSPLYQMNVTNLVDIALTLVIILLMISPLIEQGINVRLPKSAPYKISPKKSIIITIAPKNRYYIGSRRVSLRQLYRILKEKKRQNPEISIIVKGDEKIYYEELIKVLNIVRKCDIKKIGLATRQE